MDYRCGLGLLGNLSTALRSRDPRGTVGRSYSIRPSGHRFSGCGMLLLINTVYIHSSLLILCFYVSFHSFYSNAHMLGRTLVHEFHIFYSHSEWYFLSSLKENGDKICIGRVELNRTLKLNSSVSKKGKVFYGQEPPSGESTTTECGFNYQLLAVIY